MGDGLDLSSSEYISSFILWSIIVIQSIPWYSPRSWSPPCCYCCADNDVITGRSPCVRPGCPRSPDFSCLYSLFAPGWVGAGLWPLSLPGYQHFSYWPQYPPRSQELVNSQPGLGLGVINTLGYKMELINRCYYLQRAVQESNEGSLLSQRVGADVNVGYFVEPNKWGTENCL